MADSPQDVFHPCLENDGLMRLRPLSGYRVGLKAEPSVSCLENTRVQHLVGELGHCGCDAGAADGTFAAHPRLRSTLHLRHYAAPDPLVGVAKDSAERAGQTQTQPTK
jgi:hypothetical protein